MEREQEPLESAQERDETNDAFEKTDDVIFVHPQPLAFGEKKGYNDL